MTEIVNEAAERELLGSLIIFYTPELLASVRPLLRDDDFYYSRHRIAWRAVLAVSDHGDHVDGLTVASFLRGHRDAEKRSYLELAGGEAHLQLLEACATANGVVERARIVAADGEWRRRLASAFALVEACEARDEQAWLVAMGVAPRLRVVDGGKAAAS